MTPDCTCYNAGLCPACREANVSPEAAARNVDGETHDGEPWEVCDDDLCIVARRAQMDNEYGESTSSWAFFGSWRFAKDTDFRCDESIGWEIRQLFRTGYVEVRVLHRREAEHMYVNNAPAAPGGENDGS